MSNNGNKVIYTPNSDLSVISCPVGSCNESATLIYSRCPHCEVETIECIRCDGRWTQEELAYATK